MKTLANVIQSESCHWYFKDGRPCYEVKAKSKDGMRPATLRDARELNLLPSVTTILQVLHKFALERWKIEQAVLACMTTPRLENEALDIFLDRVLNVEQIQNQEAKQAADIGTDIHGAIELACMGEGYDEKWKVFVEPVLLELRQFGVMSEAEKIVTSSHGYAGKLDYKAVFKDLYTIVDFKTCNDLPKKESWLEHKLQLSGYAYAAADEPDNFGSQLQTANIYISKKEPGKVTTYTHSSTEWFDTFSNGFLPLVKYWQWANQYKP